MTRKQPLGGYSALLLVGCGDGGGLSLLTDGIWPDLEERCRWRWRGRDFVLETFDNSEYRPAPTDYVVFVCFCFGFALTGRGNFCVNFVKSAKMLQGSGMQTVSQSLEHCPHLKIGKHIRPSTSIVGAQSLAPAHPF